MAEILTDALLLELSAAAWNVRHNAHLLGGGKTKVGCAVLDENNNIFVGANIQHSFRSHDIHAEISAISALVSAGGKQVRNVLIAAERELFTPCGACMDWIMQFGGENCSIMIQADRDAPAQIFRSGELMPFYPR